MSNIAKQASAGGENLSLADIHELIAAAMRHTEAVLKSTGHLNEIATLERRSKPRSIDFRRDRVVPRAFRD